MYEQVFQFQARPFTATPFVKHYFAASAMDQALAHTRLCIDRAAGPVVTVGDVGLGKSLFLAMLEAEYQSAYTVVNLGCSRLETRKDLLQSILFKMNQPIIGRTEAELRFTLMDLTKPGQVCPAGMLLLVDDAETLTVDLVDELRLVTNYIIDGQPRIRLVMAGRNGLEDSLADPRLASFNQRIAARCYLHPLSYEETAAYIVSHIDRVGGNGAELFPMESLKRIHEVTQGCPRLVNQLCEVALILCGTSGQAAINCEMVDEAWADVQCLPGALSPMESSQQQQLQDDPDWTVIEFGQLPEDGSSPQLQAPPSANELPQVESATPEFANESAPAATESAPATSEPAPAPSPQLESPMAAEPAPAPQWSAQPPAQAPLPLAEATETTAIEEAVAPSVAESEEAEVPAPAEPAAEPQIRHADHVDFEQLAEAAKQLSLNVPQEPIGKDESEDGTDEEDGPSEQDIQIAQRQAEQNRAEMEAQLAAVFGNVRPAPSSQTDDADSSDDRPNAEPNSGGEAASTEGHDEAETAQPPATAGFAAFPTTTEAWNEEARQQPSLDIEDQPAQPATSAAPPMAEQPETPVEPAPSHWAAVDPQPIAEQPSPYGAPDKSPFVESHFEQVDPAQTDSLTPVASDSREASDSVPVEVRDSAVSPSSAETTWAPEPVEETAEPEATGADSNDPAETVAEQEPQSEPATAQHDSPTANPFAESFEAEEPLRDRFAPIIAQHNAASLAVSSSDLEFVQPDDQESTTTPTLSFHATVPMDTTSDPVFGGQSETADHSDMEASQEASTDHAWPVSTDPTLKAGDVSEFAEEPVAESEPTVPESNLEQVPAETDEPIVEDTFAESTSEMPVADQAGQFDPYESQQFTSQSESGAEPVAQEPAVPVNEQDVVPTAESPTESVAETQFEPVAAEPQEAPEAPAAPVAAQPAQPVVTDEISRQVDAIMKRLDQARALSQGGDASESQMTTETVESRSAPTEPNPVTEAPDRSEQILEEIRRQRAMIAEQVAGTSESPAPAAEATGSSDSAGPADANSGDDDDLIVVNYMNQPPAAKVKEAPAPPTAPETPVSTGRAQRMDYQQLFQQLRQSESEESEQDPPQA